MSDPLIKTGFIGLGAMGHSMAKHVHGNGLLQVVGNRTRSKAENFAEDHGVIAAKDARDFADCDVVMLCVSADADVIENVSALAQVMKLGSVIVDHSTVSMDTAKLAHALLADKGIGFLDAPVSGGVEGARNGKLSVMVGGDADDLHKARIAIDSYALRITHMGGSGAGQATKAVNQVLVAGIAEAVCEGLALGEALGLDAQRLVPTLAAGAAGNWFLDKRGLTMLASDFTPGFKCALLLKDLKIVEAMARDAGVESSVIAQSLRHYAALVEDGFGEEDTSALIRIKRGG